MSETDTETVALRVASSVKERWEQEAGESPEYDSLSHLIRLSVQKEIEGDHTGTATDTNTTTDTGTSQEVLSAINTLRGEVDGIQAQLNDVTREIEAMQKYDNPTKQIIFDALPKISGENTQNPARAGFSVEEIAEKVNRDTSIVSDICQELSNGITIVCSGESGNKTYYWVEE